MEESISANQSFNFLNNLNIDQDVTRRLSLLLSSTIVGSSDVLETPIGRDTGASRILSEWDKVFQANKSLLNDTLLKIEEEQRSKYGPRSLAKPWESRKQTLLDSYQTSNGRADIIDSLPSLSKDLKILRPLSIDNAMKLLQNTTNSGLPFYTKKGTVKERVLQKFDDLLDRKDPCILFTRTQEQHKTRNVWGFPIADTLNEMRYYAPLLAYQKRLPYRAAVQGPTEVDSSITRIIRSTNYTDRTLISIDFSAFDNTVKSSIQKLAFNYIKSLFQANCLQDLNYIESRFRDIGIITPDGVFSGNHGVPSGSTFTNEVDSLAQAIIALSHDYIEPGDMQVQGDDGVYAVPTDKISEFMKLFELCGLEVNDEKSYTSKDYCVYLQNLYHKDYESSGLIGGIYPVYRALNRLVYQERWARFEDYGISGRDYYAIRTICIVENCKYHPLFKELVKFMLKHDKYSLDPSDYGITKYMQMLSKTQSAGGILNHQYGDNVDGIRSFETFKLIKELS